MAAFTAQYLQLRFQIREFRFQIGAELNRLCVEI